MRMRRKVLRPLLMLRARGLTGPLFQRWNGSLWVHGKGNAIGTATSRAAKEPA